MPEWRGANTLNWVLIEGAEETGVTAHWLTPEFDRGPIVMRRSLRVSDQDTALSLSIKLGLVTRDLFLHVLSDIKSGKALPAIPQDEARARYFRRRLPEDGRIDWSKSDREIYNLIRALVNPWPGAFTEFTDGSRLYFAQPVALSEIPRLRDQYIN